jgi:hypothetical protein
MISDWVSFLTYPNLFGIKDFVVVVFINKQHVLNLSNDLGKDSYSIITLEI